MSGARPCPTVRAQRPGTARRRSGIALLLALAAVVLVLAALGGGLAALARTQRVAGIAAEDERLRDALAAGEAMATAWLAQHSETLVLPPAGGGVTIAHDLLALGSGSLDLSVTIYDGLAGIPAQFAQRGEALRFALPDAYSGIAVPSVAPGAAVLPSDLIERIDLPSSLLRFPAAPSAPATLYLEGDAAAPAPAAAAPGPGPGPSLAEVISVHSDGRINVNTAPATLLRQAFTQLNLGDPATLLDNRRRAIFCAAPIVQNAAPGTGLRLVASSNLFQALILTRWRGVERRWWVVIAGNPPDFTIVQRHAAD
jgi:hypothetical protein